MNWKTISANLVNKIPKILLLIVVLFLLARNKEQLFGIEKGARNRTVTHIALTPEFVGEFYDRTAYLRTEDSIFYEVRFDPSAEDAEGYVICGDRTTNYAKGFGGPVPVVIFMDEGMVIRGVRMLPNSETRRFVEEIESEGFLQRWDGRHLFDPPTEVDATSGSTYTTGAIITNVESTIGSLLDRRPAPFSWKTFKTYYLGEFAILAVIILSLLCFLFPVKTRRWRVPMLVLTVAVLGFWQGAFVSMDLLYKWLVWGTSVWVRIGIFTYVTLSLLLPLLTNKHFNCVYVCPFGNAQELVGKILPRKRPIPANILRMGLWLRRLTLVVAVVLLLILPHVELAEWEPFTVFLIRAAAVSSIVLAAISLVASLFFQRPWCRLLCPTGEILSILRRPVRYPGRFGKK